MFKSIVGCIVLSAMAGCASPGTGGAASTTTTPSAEVEPATASGGAACTFPMLREELLAMKDVDQGARTGITSGESGPRGMEGLLDIDARNTARMKEIIEEFGWPTNSLVGEDGARAAWLLVQHADRDPAFQRQCLQRMKSFGDHEVSRGDVAYLTDRVLVSEGKPQVYGTQFHEVDGHHEPFPIEDPDAVDARRAAVGLGTLAEYREVVGG